MAGERASNYLRALKYGWKIYPEDIVGAGGLPLEGGKVWFVDGDKTTGGSGTSWNDAFAETDFDGNVSDMGAISAGDVIMVAARTMAKTDTDPTSYTTNLVMDVPQVSLIGVSRGLTQGGLPQLKVGATTTSPIVSVQAPGVMLANLGFNGSGATGSAVKFFDDGGSTYASFGGSILGCHFKNARGSSATNGALGGAIVLSGAPWQIRIEGNRFYKCLADIVLLDTSNAVPQDVVIKDNVFSPVAANTDINIYGAGGSGFGVGLTIDQNIFGASPNISSGTNAKFIDLTGADGGVLTRNMFGAITAEAETDVTFGATGDNIVPTTVFMAGNWGENGPTAAAADGAAGEVYRTA